MVEVDFDDDYYNGGGGGGGGGDDDDDDDFDDILDVYVTFIVMKILLRLTG